jgi:hypothetical protein
MLGLEAAGAHAEVGRRDCDSAQQICRGYVGVSPVLPGSWIQPGRRGEQHHAQRYT